MDYSYDEQEQDVADLAATVLAKAGDHIRLRALADDGAAHDDRAWAELVSAGLASIAIPEEHGGSGAGFLELCLIIAETARTTALLFPVESSLLGAGVVSRYGDVDQVARWVATFAAGELLLSGTSGSGLRAISADGGWRLSGAVAHVPLAEISARIVVRAADERGRVGLFLLDPTSTEVTTTPHGSVDRRRRWHIEAASAPAETLVAPGDLDPADLARLDAEETTARVISQLGTAEEALTRTARYVTEREQFGRPIGTFQAVSHSIADAYIDVQGVRLTGWRAAWLLAQADVSAEETAEAVALAAVWATHAPTRVLEAAMQAHGGIGVDMDYPLHRYFLAARQGVLSLGGPNRALSVLGDLMAVAA